MELTLLETLCLLIACHYLADFPLQGQFLSDAKNPNHPIGKGIWQHALFGHACIHGLFVGLITGYVWFAIAEVIAHAVIDYYKCAGKITFADDQRDHLTCKFIYVGIIWWLGL